MKFKKKCKTPGKASLDDDADYSTRIKSKVLGIYTHVEIVRAAEWPPGNQNR